MNFQKVKKEVMSVLYIGRFGYRQKTEYRIKVMNFLTDFEVSNITKFCERYPDAIPQLFNFLIRIKSQL